MEILEDLQEKLRDLPYGQHKEIAQSANVSTTYMWEITRAKKTPTLPMVERLYKALGYELVVKKMK